MNSFFTLSWHLAQVFGTLNLKIGDLGLPAERMSCEPWQSVHTAALLLSPFSAIDLPWTLSSYARKGVALWPLFSITNFCPWQVPQVAGTFVRWVRDWGSLDGSTSWILP